MSIIFISSPAVAEEGNVTVNVPPLVSQKYPFPATAVKLAVFGVESHEILCTVAHVNPPVFPDCLLKYCPLLPALEI